MSPLAAPRADLRWVATPGTPEVWFWPPLFDSTDPRYLGSSETGAAYVDDDLWGPAIARCDVIGIGVLVAREISTGTDGCLAKLAKMAAHHRKRVCLVTGGPLGLTNYPTGAASATVDLDTAVAFYEAQGGTFDSIRMDSPMRRILESTATGVARSISSVSAAAAAVVTTSTAHGYSSGQTVRIAGTTTTPSINGFRVVTVTGDTTFTVPITTSAGQAGAGGTAGQTLPMAIEQVVDYMETIHASRPDIDIGMDSTPTHWDYDGMPTYGSGHYGWDFKDALDDLMAAIGTAGETLHYLHMDTAYEFLNELVGTGSSADHWWTRMAAIQAQAIGHGLDFGLTTTTAFGGGGETGSGTFTSGAFTAPFAGSNEAYQRWSLIFAEQIVGLVAAGRLAPLEHIVIQSFYSYPDDLAPATTAYTFADTFLKVRELFV